jgi:hypothetical protein
MTRKTLSDNEIVRIVQAYYDAVDSGDPARVAAAYHPGENTTLRFNTDPLLVGRPAIEAFSLQFMGDGKGVKGAVAKVRHSRIEVWAKPLMGDIVPVDLGPERCEATVTVLSTALPTFSVGEGDRAQHISIPAASIFTIDVESEKLVSTHNMFDMGPIYAAVGAAH